MLYTNESESIKESVQHTLKSFFGYDTLREGQEELIQAILSGKDVLGIMPTGAGKSLCYQVPALILAGITIVVAPLISLMVDQVKSLNQAGVHAAYINSSLTEHQIDLALSYAMQGRYKIIYVAPERLLTGRFLQFAMHADISMVAVDEAHCISQWGQDFRPSYLGIADFLHALPKRPVVAGFTATATNRVKEDIIKILGLQGPEVVLTGFDRPNLFLRVLTKKGGRETDNSVLNYVKQHSEENGIIYCATRKNVDKLYELLLEYGISVGRYHAGMSTEERQKTQDDFTFDRIRVMVATNAFGMGIDKSNIRYVLHYNMPQSIEYYYQEAGRAGRDGEEAECVLYFSKQDIMINKRLINSKRGNDEMSGEDITRMRTGDQQRLNQMIRYCETSDCLRQYILDYFGDDRVCECNKCSNCVYMEEETEEIYIGKKAKKRAVLLELSEQGQILFESLRQMRAELAKEQSVPPYVICSDKTLKDICVQLPQTQEALFLVYGMGAHKVENYGEMILQVVNTFIMEQGIKPEAFSLSSVDGAGVESDDMKKSFNPIMTGEASKKMELKEFMLSPEVMDTIEFPETFNVSGLTKILNERKDVDRKKVTAAFLNSLLVQEGYLSETEQDGRKEKRVTEKGMSVGMLEEERVAADGRRYYAISHSPNSGVVILECLKHYFAESGTS